MELRDLMGLRPRQAPFSPGPLEKRVLEKIKRPTHLLEIIKGLNDGAEYKVTREQVRTSLKKLTRHGLAVEVSQRVWRVAK